MANELKKIKESVKTQLSKTDKVIASNEAIADMMSGLDNTLSEVNSTLSSGFSRLGAGLQELCFNINDGFRELSYKLDLQNDTLKRIEALLEGPLDTQAKELRKRGKLVYDNNLFDEAETDLLEAVQKNYLDFIALHILGNIYSYHKENNKENNQKALDYYEKAGKYAALQSKADACTAWRDAADVCSRKLGKAAQAYEFTGKAINLLPEDTHNLYNHAAYAAMIGYTGESIDY